MSTLPARRISTPCIGRRRKIAAAIVAAACLQIIFSASRLSAEPATAPLTPSLQTLSREIQAIYESIRPCVVRVDFPVSVRTGRFPLQDVRDEQLRSWLAGLSPEALRLIESIEARSNAAPEGGVQTAISPVTRPTASQPVSTEIASTQPSTQPATLPPISTYPSLPRSVVSPATRSDLPPGGSVRGFVRASPDGRGMDVVTMASPLGAESGGAINRSAALVFDDLGHVVLPFFIDPKVMRDVKVSIVDGSGKSALASLVGSDQKTGVSVFKTERPIGSKMPRVSAKPPDGALAILLAGGGESAKLVVWTSAQREQGIVVDCAGGVCGFARPGQFLSIEAARPLVEQIIQFGRVKRAVLGVVIVQEQTADGTAAIRIDDVLPGSPAQTAGLRAGDFVLSVAGEMVSDVPTFAATIAKRDGDTVLQIWRDGKMIPVTVELRQK